MPISIQGVFITDITLAAVYLVDGLLGFRWTPFSNFIDLNGEENLTAWYGSIKLFVAALLLTPVCYINFLHRTGGWLIYFLFAFVFTFFSLDDIAQIHEWLGRRTDVFLPTGDRRDTAIMKKTGLSMIVIGIPTAIGLFMSAYYLGGVIRDRKITIKYFLGLFLVMGSQIGLDFLENFVIRGTVMSTVQIFCEGVIGSLGVTVLIWANWELLDKTGLTMNFGPITEIDHQK